MPPIDRRSFLATAVAAPALSSLSRAAAIPARRQPAGAVAIASGNGLRSVTTAVELMRGGSQPVDGVVAGVSIVEDDPDDTSVGYGGLPNERGVVQLDASVMDGPSHKAGAVAALENIRNAAQVALKVLRRTDHVMIVGAGALEFAKAHGFEEQDMLTERARQAWLRWKENLSPRDDWLDGDQRIESDDEQSRGGDENAFTYGTIHCSGLAPNGDLGACTTTSGLSYKIPGRVGDSPIIGAGMFVLNEVGSAGATGRGESVIQSCGAFQAVQHMANGDEPTEACLKVLKWIADHTKRHDLLNEQGHPNFGVTMYALRQDGLYGSATMRGRAKFAVHDGTEARREQCATLFGE